MKTNVSIKLDDQQRKLLADVIDNKQTARLATRADIVKLCQLHIAGLLEQNVQLDPPEKAEAVRSGLYDIDPADEKLLHGKEPGYIRGWNLVKRSGLT